jgi:diamine N-acetyltransferase
MEKTWQLLENDLILLRKVEPEDLEFLYSIENNSNIWFVSETKAPFSRWQIKQHIENSVYDIYTSKELRLIIINKKSGDKLGIIDLFEFDPFNLRAGIGVVIESEYWNRNVAADAIELVVKYVFEILNLNQLWCYVDENNYASIKLFGEKLGFEKSGIFKLWKIKGNKFLDVYFYQLINKRK